MESEERPRKQEKTTMARDFNDAQAEDDEIENNGEHHLALVDERTGMSYYADRAIWNGPSKAAKASSKVARDAEKAAKAAARAKKALIAPFKKDAKFARIISVIGHNGDLQVAVLDRMSDDRFAQIMSLTDEDMLQFAELTAAHRAINTSDKSWHEVKADIVARFGFRF